jgi:nitrous oxidase accessory protein
VRAIFVLLVAAAQASAAGGADAIVADPAPAPAEAGVNPSEHAAAPATLEGRAAPADQSPLQERIDAAAPGATVPIGPGEYRGDLTIDRPLRLVGSGRPRLVGSGRGSVVLVRAADVTIEGFDIDGRGGGSLMRDSSGVHVAGRRARLIDLRIERALFGIYLREADGTLVERCRVRGLPGKSAGEKGSGIHLWNTRDFRLVGNDIAGVRDGLYVQSSPGGVIAGNVARDLRYGLHYMYSDDNIFEDNTFADGAAGAALMYSRRIAFRRNRLVHNRGFASAGLLLKACDDVLAEDNLIADNARGVFLEGSGGCVVRRNIVAGSDRALVLYDSCSRTRITGNAFVGNLTPLDLVGRRTDTDFDGNYWSGNREVDLDGDGRTDRPYRLSDVFDHLRGNLLAADLMAQGTAAAALGAAEEAFPVLQPIAAVDGRPLARPPSLPDVPAPEPAANASRRGAAAISACASLAATVFLARAARRPVHGPVGRAPAGAAGGTEAAP